MKADKIRRMSCCCCGSATLGRQWWNQDTGYGLCADCPDWIQTRAGGKYAMDPQEFERTYGKRGYHYGENLK